MKKQAHHGALNYQELESLGIPPAEVIDFSSNINPYGPIKAILDAITHADTKSYPDRDSIQLRRSIGTLHKINVSQILTGNGAAELIWLLCFTLLQAGDEVLILGPTFGEYERCANLMSAVATVFMAKPEKAFQLPLHTAIEKVAKAQPKLVFMCNPNNPTGGLYPHNEISKLVSAFPQTHFVIDEAYIDFVPQAEPMKRQSRSNLILLRSMTKYYALAGVRLGYVLASPEIIERLENVRPVWNVNSLAQAAGVAALQNKLEADKSLHELLQNTARLKKQFANVGLPPVESSTHYFIVKVGKAKELRKQLLLKHKIQVRDCSSFGLFEHIRISTRLPEENELLVQAIEKVLQSSDFGTTHAR